MVAFLNYKHFNKFANYINKEYFCINSQQMTNREIVSQMTNILKTNNKDGRFSRRFILKLLEDSASFLISQRLGDRTILSETNLYTTINCFEFEKINAKNCPSIEFRLCDILMKSKKPLPRLIFSRLGASIREIISLDGDYRFNFIDETQFRRNKKRKYQLKNEVSIYLGTDHHLYIPNQEILSVDLTVLTPDKSSETDCSGCSEDIKCRGSKFDETFVCPQKLIEAVKEITLQKLGISKQIIADPNPNGLEGR